MKGEVSREDAKAQSYEIQGWIVCFEKNLRNGSLVRLIRMNTKHILALLILFVAACETSFALISIRTITREDAAELKIEVRAKAGGPDQVWIEMEFNPAVQSGKFQHVSLEITDENDGFVFGWTPLKDQRTRDGKVLVRMMGSRKFLNNVTLRIVHGELGSHGLDVRLKDFVDFENLDVDKPRQKSEATEKAEPAPPAATTVDSKS